MSAVERHSEAQRHVECGGIHQIGTLGRLIEVNNFRSEGFTPDILKVGRQ
jgi:hypothetical protein